VRIFDFKCDKCHTYADFFNIENILWHNIIKKMMAQAENPVHEF